jgi:hypothetical protein
MNLWKKITDMLKKRLQKAKYRKFGIEEANMRKRMWNQPELIVLLRGQPEESVLEHCKTQSVGINPGTYAQHCGYVAQNRCASCQSRGGKAS